MKTRIPTTCPVVFSLEIFGDKWSLIILRDILFSGKSHFGEFLASSEKIARNILSNRLESLVKEGMITKEPDPANKSAVIYRPTKKTLELLPMMMELLRSGNTYNMYVTETDAELQKALDNPRAFQKSIVERFTH